ncbi:DltD N-terminal domain protein [Durotheca rogersii]|uniref:DltD N-terminal domain protein n=1 Tax=Durotheca rogersii TaxID=419775 RepID=UPI00221FE508|nr:DltD N-terminal domain protein [Durotheca rogersii]KAI5862011.1 DltD N-terminal domain protein [Durotheca rogersii]
MSREDVEFKTLDGLTLRGHLYPAGAKSAAVIMTPGFNTTRDVFLPNIAQYFQSAGITALVYDPRTVASSDGTPPNNINPAQQVGDYHDALTFLKSDPRVDANRIAYWGFSFSGAVALCAAALDKRAKLVVAVCPLTIWELPENKRLRVMAKAMQDRESQLAGNAPFRLPMVTEKGDNPAGFGGSGVGPEELRLIAEAKEKLGFEASTTLQTYYNIMAWSPFDLIRFIAPTPTLLVTPEEDAISPADKQRELYYERIDGPKKIHVVAGRGHMNALDGETFAPTMEVQVEFIRSHLGK